MFWICAFVVATYSWMVAFEHGFAWKGFSNGFQSEWRNVGSLLMGKQVPATSVRPAPQASPK